MPLLGSLRRRTLQTSDFVVIPVFNGSSWESLGAPPRISAVYEYGRH